MRNVTVSRTAVPYTWQFTAKAVVPNQTIGIRHDSCLAAKSIVKLRGGGVGLNQEGHCYLYPTPEA